MAEQRVNYSGLQKRQSQVQLQVPGAVGVPSGIPPQRAKVQGKLANATRAEQLAKALGQLKPSLRGLFVALGEGSGELYKQQMAREEKLQEQNKLLGETLADAGFLFKEQDVEGQPKWKVVNDTTGEVKNILTDDDLPSGVNNPLQLTKHNIDAVQKFHSQRKAYHKAEAFNIESVSLSENFLKQLKLDYDELKRENQLPISELTNEPILFRTYYSNELLKLRGAFYAQFPEDLHPYINIEKGLGNYRSAYAKDHNDEIYAGIIRDTATSTGQFVDNIPETGATPDSWLNYKNNIINPGNVLPVADVDKMLINSLNTRLDQATSIDQLNRLKPDFLYQPNKKGFVLSQGKGLTDSVSSYRNKWHTKYDAIEEAEEKKLEEAQATVDSTNTRILNNVATNVRTVIANNALDGAGNRKLISSMQPLIIALTPLDKDPFDLIDKLFDQAETSETNARNNADKLKKEQEELDKKRDTTKAQALTGQIGKNINNQFGKVVAVNNLTSWDFHLNKISDFSNEIFTALNNNQISKEQASFLLGRLDREHTRLFGYYQDSTKLSSEAAAEKRLMQDKKDAGAILMRMFQQGDQLSANELLLQENSQLFERAGYNLITIDTKLRTLEKYETDKKVPKPVETDKETYVSLLDQIDALDSFNEAEEQFIRRDINDFILMDKLSLADASRLRGYLNKEAKDKEWTRFGAYTDVKARVLGRYSSEKLSPFTKRGRAELFSAQVNARFIFSSKMRKWAESLGRAPTEPEVAEKAEEVAQAIFNDPQQMELESRSIQTTEEAEDTLNEILKAMGEEPLAVRQETEEKPVVKASPKQLQDAFDDFKNNINVEQSLKVFSPYLTKFENNTRYSNITSLNKRDREEAKTNFEIDYVNGMYLFKDLDNDVKDLVYDMVLQIIEKTE